MLLTQPEIMEICSRQITDVICYNGFFILAIFVLTAILTIKNVYMSLRDKILTWIAVTIIICFLVVSTQLSVKSIEKYPRITALRYIR